ncbi:hypothetical protein [Paraburkholderia sp.]|uniref:hypothetical protein n=1 Tax=Paraburkholderia sp. TaxID=1926495 RepID=UPI0023A6121E|nr:hypothetical protein [Paraburkholderia sp.]MDE1184518.1 hypothetical protein [Paraburkholderia sp.]
MSDPRRRTTTGPTTRAARDADLWALLARVRGVRVRRKLRALAEARRRERHAAVQVTESFDALQRHAEQRLRVLAECRRDRRAGAQWYATLRAHDAGAASLHQSLDDARHAHAAARDAASDALSRWRIERVRHDEAKRRLRIAVAWASGDGIEDGPG